MTNSREAVFIDKQKLIEAIEASMVEINYVEDVVKNYYDDIEFSRNWITVIDANKLLEALK
jgi:hypothetical protein